MKIRPNSRVELEYEILGPEGDLYETSAEAGNLQYRHGAGELPRPLERALEGLEAGADLELALGPGEAFGEYDLEGIVSVPRAEFEEQTPEVGDVIALAVEQEDGEIEELEASVVEVRPDQVVIDANHPLAGKRVTFRVRVVGVEE